MRSPNTSCFRAFGSRSPAALSTGAIRALSFEFGSGNINSRTFFRDFWELLTGYRYGIYIEYFRVGEYCKSRGTDEDLEYLRGVSNYIAALPRA